MSYPNQRMAVLRYEVKFLTPAFLGNAEQAGQWRTPPFKALLRQWWRVAVAKEFDYVWKPMRIAEGQIFGHAYGNDKPNDPARASRVRLRLEPAWNKGTRKAWSEQFERVTTTRNGKGGVPSDLYAGYGPIQPGNPRERAQAIDPEEKADLRLLCMDHEVERETRNAIQLAHWFGAMGSRSRNGWGSLLIAESDGGVLDHRQLAGNELLASLTRPLDQCLSLDWPHAIGQDDSGPLAWVSAPVSQWSQAINEIARLLVEIRAIAKSYPNRAGHFAAVHLLGYPAGGNWKVKSWGNDARLASPLRFKLIRDDNQLRVLACHLPCALLRDLRCKLPRDDQIWLNQHELTAWQTIHREIDKQMGRVCDPWPDQPTHGTPSYRGHSDNRRGNRLRGGRQR